MKQLDEIIDDEIKVNYEPMKGISYHNDFYSFAIEACEGDMTLYLKMYKDLVYTSGLDKTTIGLLNQVANGVDAPNLVLSFSGVIEFANMDLYVKEIKDIGVYLRSAE